MDAGEAKVGRIRIYPIKALDPVEVTEARLLAAGGLEKGTAGGLQNDRRWALFDADGNFINGKRKPAVHGIRTIYDLTALEVSFGRAGQSAFSYSMTREVPEIEAYLSERLAEPVHLRENPEAGFPDDTDSPGPTLVSTGSLEAVATWFGWDVEQARLRFRANIEIAGVEPFWEDRLYGSEVHLGDVVLTAVNPCQRCIVPSRDPRPMQTPPAMEKQFAKRFAELRERHLPAWADPRDFSHYYRFAVNTKASADQAGKAIRAGDPVTV